MHVVGIDPSLSSTGVCVIEKGGIEKIYTIKSSMILEYRPSVYNRLERYNKIVDKVMSILNPLEIECALIEGYAYGANGRSIIDLAEFGGILRKELVKKAKLVREIAPSTRCRFATGSGRVEKEKLISFMTKKYAIVFNNSDEVDSFILAKLASMYVGWEEPEFDYQRKVVDHMRSDFWN